MFHFGTSRIPKMELHFSIDITLLFCYTLFASGEAAVSRKEPFFGPRAPKWPWARQPFYYRTCKSLVR